MIKKPEILVLGSASCVSANAIAEVLERRSANYEFIDFQDFDRIGAGISFEAADESDNCIFAYMRNELRISTENLRSAYFRESLPRHTLHKLDPSRLREIQAPGAEDHYYTQVLYFCTAFLAYLEKRCFCVLPVFETSLAASKLMQLALAGDIGFRIPDTYVGSDLAAMREFLTSHERSICKAFSPHSFYYEGDAYKTYTSFVTEDDLARLQPSPYPIVLQEAVVDRTDIRVGVIGKHVLAAEISWKESDASAETLDFRLLEAQSQFNESLTTFAIHSLPRDVEVRCLEMMRRLGLQYGMLDFLKVQSGEYVFLEVNPKGMYGELKLGGHQPLEVLADLLLDPETHKLV
ncbi:MAG: hypothetical protein HOP29_17260 [Phycisphaerales bacterium]|nr:hypothetical protein [Phycisphaerales bacterium]